jgi:hypothetical protein
MLNRVAEYESTTAAEATRDSAGAKRPLIRASDVTGFIQPVEKLILQYPGAALASAFLVGVLVAWWIKRK